MNSSGRVVGRFFKMIAAVFTAFIVLLGRMVQNWFLTEEEPEGFDDGVGDSMFFELKEAYRSDALSMSGEMNHITGKIDSGLDPDGWYDE